MVSGFFVLPAYTNWIIMNTETDGWRTHDHAGATDFMRSIAMYHYVISVAVHVYIAIMQFKFNSLLPPGAGHEVLRFFGLERQSSKRLHRRLAVYTDIYVATIAVPVLYLYDAAWSWAAVATCMVTIHRPKTAILSSWSKGKLYVPARLSQNTNSTFYYNYTRVYSYIGLLTVYSVDRKSKASIPDTGSS